MIISPRLFVQLNIEVHLKLQKMFGSEKVATVPDSEKNRGINT